jgi:hypothetical protein
MINDNDDGDDDDDDDACGVTGGMRIVRGNRSTRRNPAPVPLFSPQIPHDLTWGRSGYVLHAALTFITRF